MSDRAERRWTVWECDCGNLNHRRVPVAHHLTKDERDQHSLIARHRYVSHFATCPNANDWRKRG